VKFDELYRRSALILGFGTEGQATYEFLRSKWPAKELSIADQRELHDFPEELVRKLRADTAAKLNFGPRYLEAKAEVIIKTPGIPASKLDAPESVLTSHSQLFLSNYPNEKIIGVTGTKGKSTTTSLIHEMLRRGVLPAELVGNIGQPPRARLSAAVREFAFSRSSACVLKTAGLFP